MMPKAGSIVLLALLAPIFVAPAIAADESAQCDQIAAEVAARIGAEPPQYVEKSQLYALGRKGDVELSLRCPSAGQRQPRVVMRWKAAYPPRAFWNVVEDVGVKLTGASHRRVRLSAHQCHKASLLTADVRVNRRSRGLGFECHATTANGGSTMISVRRRSDFRL